jgi:hypothetical protein
MGNRKQPFGYKMALGEVVIHAEEAKVVQQIFNQYLMGESLQKLADILQEQGVTYGEGRSWNKNTIARILEDNRYAGEKGYPKLIEQEQLKAAAEKRAQKAAPPQKTELQKALRKLCTKSVSAAVEQQVTALLESLLQTPALIEQPLRCHTRNASSARMELDGILEQQPIDEERAKSLILKVAAEQYESLGDEEYETTHLRRLFTTAETMTAELLRCAVAEVEVIQCQVRLRLKNGQVIERSDLQ